MRWARRFCGTRRLPSPGGNAAASARLALPVRCPTTRSGELQPFPVPWQRASPPSPPGPARQGPVKHLRTVKTLDLATIPMAYCGYLSHRKSGLPDDAEVETCDASRRAVPGCPRTARATVSRRLPCVPGCAWRARRCGRRRERGNDSTAMGMPRTGCGARRDDRPAARQCRTWSRP